MKTYFRFDPNRYDYWPIYEAIKKYYPLGNFQDDEDESDFYQSYPGLQELEELILDNVHNEKNYQQRWIRFEEYLMGELKKDVEGTTYGDSPSFSAYIVLEQKTLENVMVNKELHFAVSMLGPFYSMYGLDTTIVGLEKNGYTGVRYHYEDEDKLNYFPAVNAITVSPYVEYEECFIKLEHKIKEAFVDYRLVPYSIHRMHLSGLTLYHSFNENKECRTIHSGLFHDHFDVNTKVHLMRGDQAYGSEKWRR